MASRDDENGVSAREKVEPEAGPRCAFVINGMKCGHTANHYYHDNQLAPKILLHVFRAETAASNPPLASLTQNLNVESKIDISIPTTQIPLRVPGFGAEQILHVSEDFNASMELSEVASNPERALCAYPDCGRSEENIRHHFNFSLGTDLSNHRFVPREAATPCPHKTLKRQNVGNQRWYRCPECQQKFIASDWDGKVKVGAPSPAVSHKEKLLTLLREICQNAYACHYQQNTFPGETDPCGQCANCMADKALGENWQAKLIMLTEPAVSQPPQEDWMYFEQMIPGIANAHSRYMFPAEGDSLNEFFPLLMKRYKELLAIAKRSAASPEGAKPPEKGK